MSTDISQPDTAQDRSTETGSPQLDNYTLEHRYLRDSGRAFLTPPETGLHYRWTDLPGPQLETRIEHKLAAVQAFARANPIDRCLFDNAQARFGIVTTGKGHLNLLEALDLLGIDEDLARGMGLAIYKVGLAWPIER
ncbi:MAG TPA: hypothetical protein VGP45_09070, partial [Marinobacter sp.]|nr:hypothetical protein [Marinobacter sp.]